MNKDLTTPEATVREVCGDISIPEMGVVQQEWETDPIHSDEVATVAENRVQALDFTGIPIGGEIAVGVGSRGIANLPTITRGVISGIRTAGYDPFVFPAMGSHGGATAAGQREKLETLGVTEDSIGCEIRSTMAVTEIGETPNRGATVYFDELACEADGIIPINRVKPHTDYRGPIESGLSKMLVIGMGKQQGAKMAHDWAVEWSLGKMIPEISEQILDTLPVVGGIAIVEDEHDDTASIQAVPAAQFLEREAELLEIASQRMPTLPFDELDVLVVDRLGKDISGQGMDTNVTGRRHFTINEPEPAEPDIKRIYTRSLSTSTNGNAMGMGQADFVHQRVLNDLDWSKSLINAITASTVRGVRLPPVLESDRAGLIASLGTVGPIPSEEQRVLRITDTMRLERCYASQPLLEAAQTREDLSIAADPSPVAFDAAGNFTAGSPD